MLAYSFIFSICWAAGIAVFSYMNFELLLIILEMFLSPDGHISFPRRAIYKVMLAPLVASFLLYAFSRMFSQFNPTLRFLKWHLMVFITHLIFYILYTKFVLHAPPLEGGLLETATFILATIASILFFVSGVLRIRFALFLGLCWLFFALEEGSWGQSFLNFESPKLFMKYNLQKETNIHNFFNPVSSGKNESLFYLLYILTNITIFSLLTWARKIKFLFNYYKIESVRFVIEVSDKLSLWFYPLILSFTVMYPGLEFVEEHWSIFGLIFSLLLLIETLSDKNLKKKC